MRINNIIIEISPWYQPHETVINCFMEIDGRKIHWQEIFPTKDFENRAERYLDYMKRKIIDAMQGVAKKVSKTRKE